MLYIALTAALFGILLGLGATGVDDRMSPFHAIAHALTTIPTAGFSTKADSIESFAPATQWVIVVFMILGGFNFALMYRTLVRRQPRALARDGEARLYVALLVLGSLLVVGEIWTEDVLGGTDAVRAGIFTAVSTMTTTGFSVADYNTWPTLAMMTIVGLMFVGGSAGSTTGLGQGRPAPPARQDPPPRDRPDAAPRDRPPGAAEPPRRRRADAARGLLVHPALHRRSSSSARPCSRSTRRARGSTCRRSTPSRVSASMLANVGPAFGVGGPLGSFEPFSDFSTILMTGLMWLGRLEIVPIVVLVSRHYWRNA